MSEHMFYLADLVGPCRVELEQDAEFGLVELCGPEFRVIASDNDRDWLGSLMGDYQVNAWRRSPGTRYQIVVLSRPLSGMSYTLEHLAEGIWGVRHATGHQAGLLLEGSDGWLAGYGSSPQSREGALLALLRGGSRVY